MPLSSNHLSLRPHLHLTQHPTRVLIMPNLRKTPSTPSGSYKTSSSLARRSNSHIPADTDSNQEVDREEAFAAATTTSPTDDGSRMTSRSIAKIYRTARHGCW